VSYPYSPLHPCLYQKKKGLVLKDEIEFSLSAMEQKDGAGLGLWSKSNIFIENKTYHIFSSSEPFSQMLEPTPLLSSL